MNAQRVEVLCENLRGQYDRGSVIRVNKDLRTDLHVADCDAVVVAVTDNFVLDFLPTLHALLNENLRAGSEGFVAERNELLSVLSKTTAQTAERKGSADDDGVANLFGGLDGFVDGNSRARLGAFFTDLFHGLGEVLAILGRDDGVDGCTQNLHTQAREVILELDTDVKRSLTTEGNIDAVGLLGFDNTKDEFGGDGEEEDLVGQAL